MHRIRTLLRPAPALFLLLGTAAAQQSQRGALIVLNKSEATASIIDAGGGRTLATVPTGPFPHEVAVSPDGRLAVVANYGNATVPGSTLSVLDLEAARVTRTVDLGTYRRPHGIAWSRDGRTVAVTVEADQAVLVVDAGSWTVVRAIPTGQQVSHMVALAPDGRRAYVASIGSGSVAMLDLEAGTRLRVAPTGAGTEGIDVSPDGREVWATNRAANTVRVLDAATLDTLATIPAADFPIRVKLTPDGRLALVSCARSSEVRVFDTATRRAVGTIRFPLDTTRATMTILGTQFAGSAVPIGILIAPDGRTAWVATGATGQVAEVDIAARRIVRYLTAGLEPDGLGFTPNPVAPR